jgi:hypothetical protein
VCVFFIKLLNNFDHHNFSVISFINFKTLITLEIALDIHYLLIYLFIKHDNGGNVEFNEIFKTNILYYLKIQ